MPHANSVEKSPYDLPMVREYPPSLIAHKCLDCGKLNFPPTPTCISCLGTNIEECFFGQRGRLYSYTIVRVPMPGFEAPYSIGYIDLEEGLRLFSYIANWQNRNLKNGAEMELIMTSSKMDGQGNKVLGFAYQPTLQ